MKFNFSQISENFSFIFLTKYVSIDLNYPIKPPYNEVQRVWKIDQFLSSRILHMVVELSKRKKHHCIKHVYVLNWAENDLSSESAIEV